MSGVLEIKETVIELDSNLEQIEIKSRDVDNFNKSISNQSTNDNLKLVRDCIKGNHRHLGYLEYLGEAWKYHYGVIFTPDFFWQLFLTEVATHIKNNSGKYRSLFTESQGDTMITVPTGDPQLIDLNLIIEGLRGLVPTNTDIFLPEFTTTTMEASMAFNAAFADAMSPYYSYSMYMCGIPSVKLLGDENDWDTIIGNIESLSEIIDLPTYFDKVTALATTIKSNINNPDVDFWTNMFSLKRCGSGGQTEVEGWINDLYVAKPSPAYIQNYPSGVSFVSYKFLGTGQEYELCYGLFSSNIEGDYLAPEFGYVINEKV